MTTDFRQELIAFAKCMIAIAPKCSSEEGTKLFLVLPFLKFLGYDCKNPFEVSPEHGADFSEKYKNRVDYAILKEDEPVIAVECKCVCAAKKDDRGQPRSYFNAVKTIKMGILTDGLTYEFYADSNEPNMMDQDAFLMVDLTDAAKGKIEESAIDGLARLKKATVDPDNIGAEAKKKIIFQSIIHQLDALANDPNEPFTRMLLQNAGLIHIRANGLAEYQELVKVAFREFINLRILQHLDISTKETEKTAALTTLPSETNTETAAVDSGIVTTETEMEAFHYANQRLAFLVEDEDSFDQIGTVQFRDYKGKFVVFHSKERAGRLFDFFGGDEGDKKYRFVFPDGVELTGGNLHAMQIDKPLLDIFRKRLAGV